MAAVDPPRNRVVTVLVWTSAAILAFFLLAEHQAHVFGILPWLLILACPAMHLLMHRGHHGSHHESARAVEWGEPATDEGHSAVPDGALLPDAALRDVDDGVETVARDSDDRGDASAARPAASRHGDDDEGGRSRIARGGGRQRRQALAGRKGLDRGSMHSAVSAPFAGEPASSGVLHCNT
jgi:hypothetical protein